MIRPLLSLLLLTLLSCGKSTQVRYKQNIIPHPFETDQVIEPEVVNITPPGEAYKPGTVLMKTQWGQTYPFNKNFPKINGASVVTGCTTTALAQLVYYHTKAPVYPRGRVTHELAGTSFVAFKKGVWNIPIIPAKFMGREKEEVTNEISDMFLDIAVANRGEMMGDGLSSRVDQVVMTEYLPFKRTIVNDRAVMMTKETSDTFGVDLKKEIDELRPVLVTMRSSLSPEELETKNMRPLAHAVVIDGYKIENEKLLFHVNFGWSGLNNGFYDLSQPFTVESNIDSPYHADELLFKKNIQLCQGDCPKTNLEKSDVIKESSGGAKIKGKLNGFDLDSFDVTLKAISKINFSKRHMGMYLRLETLDGKIISEDVLNHGDGQELLLNVPEAGNYRIIMTNSNQSGRYFDSNENGYEFRVE